jgi:hypothetical protein
MGTKTVKHLPSSTIKRGDQTTRVPTVFVIHFDASGIIWTAMYGEQLIQTHLTEKEAVLLGRSLIEIVGESREARGCACAPLIIDLISGECPIHDGTVSGKQ